MRVVYEGQVVRTNKEVDYDYMEVKYADTTYLKKKPFIRIPISYPGRAAMPGDPSPCRERAPGPAAGRGGEETGSSCELTCTDDSSACPDGSLDIESGEKISGLFNSSDTGLVHDSTDSGSVHAADQCLFFEYKDSDERCLLINYIKNHKTRADEGILKYNEFSDFLVTESEIVHCESFVVRKPFHVEEHLHPTFKTIRIQKFVPGDIQVSTDYGHVVPHGGEYRVFGRCLFYNISARNIAYRFPSRVYWRC